MVTNESKYPYKYWLSWYLNNNISHVLCTQIFSLYFIGKTSLFKLHCLYNKDNIIVLIFIIENIFPLSFLYIYRVFLNYCIGQAEWYILNFISKHPDLCSSSLWHIIVFHFWIRKVGYEHTLVSKLTLAQYGLSEFVNTNVFRCFTKYVLSWKATLW